jgi:hypothetical protein
MGCNFYKHLKRRHNCQGIYSLSVPERVLYMLSRLSSGLGFVTALARVRHKDDRGAGEGFWVTFAPYVREPERTFWLEAHTRILYSHAPRLVRLLQFVISEADRDD